jgi:hypothetical protein
LILLTSTNFRIIFHSSSEVFPLITSSFDFACFWSKYTLHSPTETFVNEPCGPFHWRRKRQRKRRINWNWFQWTRFWNQYFNIDRQLFEIYSTKLFCLALTTRKCQITFERFWWRWKFERDARNWGETDQIKERSSLDETHCVCLHSRFKIHRIHWTLINRNADQL